jgi:virginiamycin B lyase
MPERVLTLVVAICLVLLATGRAQAAPVVDGEFTLTKNAQRITQGPDGNMWATLGGNGLGNEIARIAPDGTVTEFDNDSLAQGVGIVAGPGDGKLWVTVPNNVVRFDPASPTTAGTPFAVDIAAGAQTIVVGPDGNLWTASADKVFKITPAGVPTTYTVLNGARGIASSGGLLWVADFGAKEIVSVTTAGTATHYPVGDGGPQEVAAGLDGQVGFTNPGARVGRLVAGGSPLQTDAAPGSDPFGIAFGLDQAYWFAQPFGNDLGRLTKDGVYTRLGGFSTDAGPRYVATGPNGTLWVALQGVGGNDAKKVARVSGLEPPAAPQPISATPPTVSKLRLSAKRFRVGKVRTPIAAQKRRRGKATPVGTSIRFTLSETADVRIAFQRKAAGRRSGGRCVKPRPRLRSNKRCTRWVKTGRALTRKDLKAGAQRIAFSGRIGRKALKPGAYRLTIVATSANGAKSKPRRAAFTVVAPRG